MFAPIKTESRRQLEPLDPSVMAPHMTLICHPDSSIESPSRGRLTCDGEFLQLLEGPLHIF
jgi:hypothetical protein